MHLKRIVSFYIILCVLVMNLSFIAYAQTSYEFNTADYSTYSGYMNTDSSGNPVPANGMGNNTSVTYENVFVEESGTYRLSAEFIGVYGKNTHIIVYYDGVQMLDAPLTLTDRYVFSELGEIPLLRGNCRITFKVADTESVYFTKFHLEKTGEITTYVRNGDSAERQSEEGITDNKPSEGMNKGCFAEYDINIEEDGYYALSLSGATLLDSYAIIDLTVDSDYAASTELCGKDWYTPVAAEYPAIHLQSGKHTLRLQIKSGAIRLFNLKLKYINENTAEEFLNEIKTADTDELDLIFEKYDGKLAFSYKALGDKLIYKDFCYKKLLDKKTDDYGEFDKTARALLKEETENPLVALYSNGNMVSELPDGNSEIVFSEKFKKPLMAVAAIFGKEINKPKAIKCTEIIPNEKTSVSGIVSEKGDELRVFFFEGENSLREGELPFDDYYIYVSPFGSDADDGSFKNPVRTFEKAAEIVSEFDKSANLTVSFLPGEYFVEDTVVLNEMHNINGEGTITFRSYDNKRPALITGGRKVEKWKPYKDGIYVAEVSGTEDVRQLYINGLPADRARGKGVFYGKSYWNDEATDFDEDGFLVESSNFPTLTKPADAEICYNILWTLQRLPVKGVEENDGIVTIKMDQPYYSQAITMLCEGGVQPHTGTQFFVENDLSLLDEEGEFYFDKDTRLIYYYPFDEEDLSLAECVAAVTEKLLCIEGASGDNKVRNINFENIDFRYGAYTCVNDTGTVSFQAECLAAREIGVNPVAAAETNRLPAQLEVKNAENIHFKNCDISCMGSSALSFSGDTENSSVTGCVFRDNGGSAVSLGDFNCRSNTSPDSITKNIKIENNVIARAGREFMFCPAITAYYANSIEIIHNTITELPYSGISLGWGWGGSISGIVKCENHIIKGNKIIDISNAVRDGGHIYLLGSLKNTTVAENFISDSTDYGGMYFDSGSSGITLENNVAEKCRNWLFGGGATTDVHIKTNYADESGTVFSANADKNLTFKSPTIYKNSAWEGEALRIYENSGAVCEREWEYTSLPEWRKSLSFKIPREEELTDGDIIVEAEDYTGFTTISSKEEPTFYMQGYRTVIGDIRQFDVMDYEVESDEGDYIVELRYSTGPYNPDLSGRVGINVLVNDVSVLGKIYLPMTNSLWAAHIPHRIGTIHLNQGKNKVSIKNLHNGFAYDNFKLIKVR